jgi:hypothetical protein
MLSDSSPIHRLYADCLYAGIDPVAFTSDWFPSAPEDTIQYDLEIFVQDALVEWKSANLNP